MATVQTIWTYLIDAGALSGLALGIAVIAEHLVDSLKMRRAHRRFMTGMRAQERERALITERQTMAPK